MVMLLQVMLWLLLLLLMMMMIYISAAGWFVLLVLGYFRPIPALRWDVPIRYFIIVGKAAASLSLHYIENNSGSLLQLL